MESPTREKLIAMAKADPETIADLVLQLFDRIEALEKLEIRITKLELGHSFSRASSPFVSEDPLFLRDESAKIPMVFRS